MECRKPKEESLGRTNLKRKVLLRASLHVHSLAGGTQDGFLSQVLSVRYLITAHGSHAAGLLKCRFRKLA